MTWTLGILSVLEKENLVSVMYTAASEQVSTSFLLKTEKLKQYIKSYELKQVPESSLPPMYNFSSRNHNTTITAFR